jgi:hypothetical protein
MLGTHQVRGRSGPFGPGTCRAEDVGWRFVMSEIGPATTSTDDGPADAGATDAEPSFASD